MHLIDYLILVLYLGGVLALGGAFFRSNRSTESYTLGDRSLPTWVVGMSIFATYVSSISFLALPGNAYSGNWNAFVFSLSIPIAAIIARRYFVPLYRRVNSPSAYAFLEERFGVWARVYASACYLLTQVMRTGTILYLLALSLQVFLGWSLPVLIISITIVVLIYSLLGGFRAVVWTDAIQGLLLIGGALTCVLYLLFSMPEGPQQLFDIAGAQGKFSLGSWAFDLKQPTVWVVLVYGLFINLQNYGIDQNYVQRYLAARTDEAAKSSAFWGGMLYIPVSLLFLFIGAGLFAFYQARPDLLPAGLAGDKVFPHFIIHQLPAGLTGLLVAAILAAGMSTISTSFNSGATVILSDYYQRFAKKPIDNASGLKVLYLSSTVLAVLGMAVGLAMINVQSALDAWWKLASVFSGGMLGLFLLGAFIAHASRPAAVAGVLLGILIIMWMSLSPIWWANASWSNPWHNYLTIVFGTAAIFLTGWLGSAKR